MAKPKPTTDLGAAFSGFAEKGKGAPADLATRAGPVKGGAVGSGASVREVTLNLKVREELRDALKDAAHERRVTVRALVMEALRDKGYPVVGEDLIDRRSIDG